MKDLFLLLAGTFAYRITQSAKSNNKFLLKNSLLTIDQFRNPFIFDTVQTRHGDIMYLSECNENDVTYGVISFELKKPFADLDNAEKVLKKFMYNLQPSFKIRHTTGLGLEPTPIGKEKALTDYWQDAEGRDWKVTGWTNGQTVAVFYVKNIGAVPVDRETHFLESLRFIAA